MKLMSSAFAQDEKIPARYTCDGENMSPPLQISDVPTGAKSLTLIMDDPDAPSGTANPGWVHWVVFNMPTDTSFLEDELPTESVAGRTDFGTNEYGGPCPPSGTHHYQFKVYALDTKLDLPAGATKQEVEEAMKMHVLDQATLTGLYSKQ